LDEARVSVRTFPKGRRIVPRECENNDQDGDRKSSHMSRLPFEDGDYVGLKVLCVFLTPDSSGNLIFDRPALDAASSFQMVHKGGKNWAFYSTNLKKYLTVTDGGQVNCTAVVPLARETFLLIGSDPRHVLFKNQANDSYLKSQCDGGPISLHCVEAVVSEQESFFEIERQ
jgi:hypothetical protein